MLSQKPRSESQSIAKATLTMSVLTTFSRITGFGRVMAFAFALGLTQTFIPDAFNLANSLPNIIYELSVGGILSSLFIPIFVEYLANEEKEEAWRLASYLMNIVVLLLTSITIIGILAAPWIIKFYTPRLPAGEEKAMMTFFLRFFVPQIIFYGMGALFTGLLNSFRKFGPPAFAPIMNNVIVIATFLLFRFVPGFGITGLAIGTTLGVISMALVQLPSLFRTGVKYQVTINLKHPGVRKIGRLAVPLFGYVLINQIGIWVVAVLATPIKGGYASYTTAFQTFYQLPHGIFAVSIITALFPTLAEHKVKNEFEKFRETLSIGIRLIAFMVIPAAAGYVAISAPIIKLTLERGMFGAADTKTLASVLQLFSLGLFSFSIYTFLTRAFYSLQDTKTPLIINTFGVGFNALANLVFFQFLQVKGLALGHAAAYTFSMVVSALVLSNKLGGLDGRNIISTVAKVIVASAGSAGAAYETARILENFLNTNLLVHQLIQVFSAILVAALVYLVLVRLLRIKEMELFKTVFWRSLARKKGIT